jgi:hypothetical protein
MKNRESKVYAQLSTALPYATTVNLNFTGTASKESIIKLQPNKLLFQQEQSITL